ncbi:MAG: dihydropteroate synthase, partial [Bacteroidia bacterium]|nr:dihydropteroate synthase [Bacteroidia bacterium]
MSTKNTEIIANEYSANGKIITFNKPLVMAIVNATPDSFYDGGKYSSAEDVLRDVEEKLNLGADIIDIGAASSRPYAEEIHPDEEWVRLKKILPEVRKKFPKALISVDTYRSEIAERSAKEGADIINDIGGGTLDKNMFKTVAKLNLPYILMHIQGTPQSMQDEPSYNNVSQDVKIELGNRIRELHSLHFNKIIVDPGFGFGKNLEHNFQLLRDLSTLCDLGYPVLAGVSRKGMIN